MDRARRIQTSLLSLPRLASSPARRSCRRQRLESYNGLHTLSQASGPGGNPGAPYYWVSALDVEPVTPGGPFYKADTVRLRTTNMNNGTTGQGTIATGPIDPFNDAATDDAHGFAEVMLNMLLDWQGENSINGNGFKIRGGCYAAGSCTGTVAWTIQSRAAESSLGRRSVVAQVVAACGTLGSAGLGGYDGQRATYQTA